MVDTRWDDTFEALTAFVTANGRLPARNSGIHREERLVQWLYYQRRLEWNGRLDSERARRLDGLWDWRQAPRADKQSAQWAETLEKLRGFVEQHGRFPSRSQAAGSQERTLAIYLNRQRRSARERTLSSERAKQLEQAIPEWNPGKDPEQPPWQQRQLEEHRAAARVKLQDHQQVILVGLASGRSVVEMSRMTGVPHQLMFGVARYDQSWSQQLEEALLQGRPQWLDHGTPTAYRYGCRCRPCREFARAHHKPRRSRATTGGS
ncbi:helicase associated domain-containing protein [Arthrobacter castelli]|uniref:helicase associated domain-containing protein n=1 Tax=Arthrobacter castelli TaxID=271431 RepID=UPI0003FA498D|nr:helicase associated domain-containing protein [Arthrobacter castelli]